MKIGNYISKLNLKALSVHKIEHQDTLSSVVYKIDQKNSSFMILKLFEHKIRFGRFERELYFLNRMKCLLPVPKVIDTISPTDEYGGAILMEFIQGKTLTAETLTNTQAYEMGKLLATIHEMREDRYGDLTDPNHNGNPVQDTKSYLEESIEECKNIIEDKILQDSRKYFEKNITNLSNLDGPCIIHRDFKPGNIIMQDNNINAIIDWESSRSSFAEEDFLRMDTTVWNEHPSTNDSFFHGYASIRTLPKLEKVLPILRIAKAIGAIGFTIQKNIWKTRGKKIFNKNLSF